MKICKDGRIWGQTNKQASEHLGTPFRKCRINTGTASQSKMGSNNPMYGKGELIRGEKHGRWKGGISSIENRIRQGIEYRLWREAVFARDNFTCQDCGKHGGELNAHHIKAKGEYPELRFAIDNGRTLCYKCHRLTDSWGRRY